MKRMAFALPVLVIAVALATAKPHAAPQSATPLEAAVSGYYFTGHQGLLAQSSAPSLTASAVYGVQAYPLYAPQLAQGDGRQETSAYCNTCHSTRYITMQPPLPAATWETEVTKMDKTFGGQFPSDIPPKIVRYLSEHYTPETRHR
jgi:hypothetical protein